MQAKLPETNPFLSDQMAILSSFLQLFNVYSTWDVYLWLALSTQCYRSIVLTVFYN